MSVLESFEQSTGVKQSRLGEHIIFVGLAVCLHCKLLWFPGWTWCLVVRGKYGNIANLVPDVM